MSIFDVTSICWEGHIWMNILAAFVETRDKYNNNNNLNFKVWAGNWHLWCGASAGGGLPEGYGRAYMCVRIRHNFDIDSRLTFENHVRGIVSHVSQIILIFRLVNCVFVDTSVLLRCYYAFVLPILECCSPVWGSAAECHLQLLYRKVSCPSGLPSVTCYDSYQDI